MEFLVYLEKQQKQKSKRLIELLLLNIIQIKIEINQKPKEHSHKKCSNKLQRHMEFYLIRRKSIYMIQDKWIMMEIKALEDLVLIQMMFFKCSLEEVEEVLTWGVIVISLVLVLEEEEEGELNPLHLDLDDICINYNYKNIVQRVLNYELCLHNNFRIWL